VGFKKTELARGPVGYGKNMFTEGKQNIRITEAELERSTGPADLGFSGGAVKQSRQQFEASSPFFPLAVRKIRR